MEQGYFVLKIDAEYVEGSPCTCNAHVEIKNLTRRDIVAVTSAVLASAAQRIVGQSGATADVMKVDIAAHFAAAMMGETIGKDMKEN